MDLTETDAFIEGKVDWKGRAATKNKHGGMRAAMFVLATFAFENMANLALGVNLVTYFNGVMHYDIDEAANHVTNFLGTCYILSIIMACLADAYMGRFRTVLLAACVECVGLALLTIQAHYPKLKPPVCNIFLQNCEKVHGGNTVLLFVAIYLLAAGNGGVKASVPSHGADQFDKKDLKEATQMSTFFNWLLLGLAVGGSISLTFFVWVQDNKGFDRGFGLSFIAMFLGAITIICGLPWYRIHVVQGSSAITEIIQVYVAAIRNQKLQLPEDPSELYEIPMDSEAALHQEFLPHRDVYRWLDKAAIRSGNIDQSPSPWKLCRVTQVENAKILLAMVPVFLCTIIMTLCLAQLQTFTVQQGVTMDTKLTDSFNMPPASLPIIPVIFLIILIPIYDQILVPWIRKFTGIPTGITYLQRVGVGLILSALSMTVAGLVEVKRKNVAKHHNMLDANPLLQSLPISVFWLSFQYFVFGIADMFTYVGLLEFFYSQAPQSIKSISSCFLWSSMAFGYYLSSITVKIVNRASKGATKSGGWLAGNNLNRNHLEKFYWMLAILSLINFIIYIFVARKYKYRPQSLDGEDEYDANQMRTLNHSMEDL
ncbi:hypothetical protein L1987_59296 [Smallanthus sonchifolius]|uniref:Uncharacterized protein n=1 Tax=Smallanthus sonchifolius TaxID=185202 RepID=A0ACB9D4V2_9ASTR|nr:hypothetical protein L1987_59296 [Smallanthus sonchifolius]